jgi:hypothetical protein
MEGFSTKQKGDIAEYRIIIELLRRGFNVLRPLGDRLPYDLAVEFCGTLARIQVKMAWESTPGNYIIDIRRSQTNRKVAKYTKYEVTDFDFLVAWLSDLDLFYIFPSEFACSFGSTISMIEGTRRQRPPRSLAYRNKWDLLNDYCGMEQSGSSQGS